MNDEVENSVRNEVIEVVVLGHVAIDPSLSTRKLQDHNEDDFDQRLQFC